MRVWTVVNQKGGVGKTTTTISLAGALIKQGLKVLVVDMDPHASLSYYLKVQNTSVTLYDIFLSSEVDVNSLIQPTKLMNLDIIPANADLATLDRVLAQEVGKGLIINKAIANLEKNYDAVILDCPPVLGVLMINALVAAQKIIIPTQTEHLAKNGLISMLSSIEALTDVLRKDVAVKIIATMFDKRLNACQKAYKVLREEFSQYLWRGYIPLDTKFRQASELGLPINIVSPDAKGCFAYEKLCNDLLYKNHDMFKSTRITKQVETAHA